MPFNICTLISAATPEVKVIEYEELQKSANDYPVFNA